MIDVREIKACMTRENLTQQDLADALGMTPKTLQERFRRECFTTDEVSELVKVLKVPMDEILKI